MQAPTLQQRAQAGAACVAAHQAQRAPRALLQRSVTAGQPPRHRSGGSRGIARHHIQQRLVGKGCWGEGCWACQPADAMWRRHVAMQAHCKAQAAHTSGMGCMLGKEAATSQQPAFQAGVQGAHRAGTVLHCTYLGEGCLCRHAGAVPIAAEQLCRCGRSRRIDMRTGGSIYS